MTCTQYTRTQTRLIQIHIILSDSADGCTCGGFPYSTELLILELSVTMSQPPHIRLALNEFQASCYSSHKSQSALCETN